MLISILCGFFVRSTGNIEKTIHARFDSIGSLVSELKGLFGICSVFVDNAVDKFMNRSEVFRSTKLT